MFFIVQSVNYDDDNETRPNDNDIFVNVEDCGDEGGDNIFATHDDNVLIHIDVLPDNSCGILPPLDRDDYDLLMNEMVEFNDVWAVFIDAANDLDNYLGGNINDTIN